MKITWWQQAEHCYVLHVRSLPLIIKCVIGVNLLFTWNTWFTTPNKVVLDNSPLLVHGESRHHFLESVIEGITLDYYGGPPGQHSLCHPGEHPERFGRQAIPLHFLFLKLLVTACWNSLGHQHLVLACDFSWVCWNILDHLLGPQCLEECLHQNALSWTSRWPWDSWFGGSMWFLSQRDRNCFARNGWRYCTTNFWDWPKTDIKHIKLKQLMTWYSTWWRHHCYIMLTNSDCFCAAPVSLNGL